MVDSAPYGVMEPVATVMPTEPGSPVQLPVPPLGQMQGNKASGGMMQGWEWGDLPALGPAPHGATGLQRKTPDADAETARAARRGPGERRLRDAVAAAEGADGRG